MRLYRLHLEGQSVAVHGMRGEAAILAIRRGVRVSLSGYHRFPGVCRLIRWLWKEQRRQGIKAATTRPPYELVVFVHLMSPSYGGERRFLEAGMAQPNSCI